MTSPGAPFTMTSNERILYFERVAGIDRRASELFLFRLLEATESRRRHQQCWRQFVDIMRISLERTREDRDLGLMRKPK